MRHRTELDRASRRGESQEHRCLRLINSPERLLSATTGAASAPRFPQSDAGGGYDPSAGACAHGRGDVPRCRDGGAAFAPWDHAPRIGQGGLAHQSGVPNVEAQPHAACPASEPKPCGPGGRPQRFGRHRAGQADGGSPKEPCRAGSPREHQAEHDAPGLPAGSLVRLLVAHLTRFAHRSRPHHGCTGRPRAGERPQPAPGRPGAGCSLPPVR